jgi:hypothetical protein
VGKREGPLCFYFEECPIFQIFFFDDGPIKVASSKEFKKIKIKIKIKIGRAP